MYFLKISDRAKESGTSFCMSRWMVINTGSKNTNKEVIFIICLGNYSLCTKAAMVKDGEKEMNVRDTDFFSDRIDPIQ